MHIYPSALSLNSSYIVLKRVYHGVAWKCDTKHLSVVRMASGQKYVKEPLAAKIKHNLPQRVSLPTPNSRGRKILHMLSPHAPSVSSPRHQSNDFEAWGM